MEPGTFGIIIIITSLIIMIWPLFGPDLKPQKTKACLEGKDFYGRTIKPKTEYELIEDMWKCIEDNNRIINPPHNSDCDCAVCEITQVNAYKPVSKAKEARSKFFDGPGTYHENYVHELQDTIKILKKENNQLHHKITQHEKTEAELELERKIIHQTLTEINPNAPFVIPRWPMEYTQ